MKNSRIRKVMFMLIATAGVLLLILVAKVILLPKGSVVLTGTFDPATTHVYINKQRILAADLGVRTFNYRHKPGTYSMLVSGPGIKTVETTISIKPLIGASVKIAIANATDSALAIATSAIQTASSAHVIYAQKFGEEWIEPTTTIVLTLALSQALRIYTLIGSLPLFWPIVPLSATPSQLTLSLPTRV